MTPGRHPVVIQKAVAKLYCRAYILPYSHYSLNACICCCGYALRVKLPGRRFASIGARRLGQPMLVDRSVSYGVCSELTFKTEESTIKATVTD